MNSGRDGERLVKKDASNRKNYNNNLDVDNQIDEEKHHEPGKLTPCDNIQKHVSLENSMSISDSSDEENDKNKYVYIKTTWQFFINLREFAVFVMCNRIRFINAYDFLKFINVELKIS